MNATERLLVELTALVESKRRSDDDELITPDEAFCLARLSKSDAWRRVEAGTFPRPVRLSVRIFRFSRREVMLWIQQMLATRDA